MITVEGLFADFPDAVELEQGILKFTIRTQANTWWHWLRLACPNTNNCDLLVVSADLADDEFAVQTLLSVPTQFPLDSLSLASMRTNQYRFSELLIVPPEFHHQLEGLIESRSDLVLCVPGHQSEFVAKENEMVLTFNEGQELEDWDDRPAEVPEHWWRCCTPYHQWKRIVHPRIVLRFDNPKAQYSSDQYLLSSYSALVNTIQLLDGAPDGFIEIINYKDQVLEILPKDPGTLELIRDRNDDGSVLLKQEELLDEVWAFLTQSSVPRPPVLRKDENGHILDPRPGDPDYLL